MDSLARPNGRGYPIGRGQGRTEPKVVSMSVVIITVAIASIIFLLYFLFALTYEQRTAPRSVKTYLLSELPPPVEKLRFSTRTRLQLVHSTSALGRNVPLANRVKIASGERLG